VLGQSQDYQICRRNLRTQLLYGEEEDEEAWQRGENFVAVGSVKPAIATLVLRVISVAKAKKKPKRKQKK
jgi:hypothetical protein